VKRLGVPERGMIEELWSAMVVAIREEAVRNDSGSLKVDKLTLELNGVRSSLAMTCEARDAERERRLALEGDVELEKRRNNHLHDKLETMRQRTAQAEATLDALCEDLDKLLAIAEGKQDVTPSHEKAREVAGKIKALIFVAGGPA
jgi:chromosome segregation ATPase